MSEQADELADFVRLRISIPGWRFPPLEMAPVIAPCQLPRSRPWLNKHFRFASARAATQLQGPALSDAPALCEVSDSLLRRIAGDGFAFTLASAHLLIAFHRLVWFSNQMPFVNVIISESSEIPSSFSVREISRYMVRKYMSLAPGCFKQRGTFKIRIGTLCSGADYLYIKNCLLCRARYLSRVFREPHALLCFWGKVSREHLQRHAIQHSMRCSTCNAMQTQTLVR